VNNLSNRSVTIGKKYSNMADTSQEVRYFCSACMRKQHYHHQSGDKETFCLSMSSCNWVSSSLWLSINSVCCSLARSKSALSCCTELYTPDTARSFIATLQQHKHPTYTYTASRMVTWPHNVTSHGHVTPSVTWPFDSQCVRKLDVSVVCVSISSF